MTRRILKWLGLVVLAPVAVALALTLWPASTFGLESSPHTIGSYREAMAEIARMRAPNLSIGHSGKPALEYQGWSTGGIADAFVLGKFVRKRASKQGPTTGSITVLLNPNDDTISNPRAEELVDAWRDHGRRVRLVWLPRTPVLEHDIIDPGQAWARPAFVYPRLVRLLDARS